MKEPNVTNAGFATQQIHSDRLVIPGYHPLVTPIFQSSTFIFDDAAQGAARFAGEESGYIYTRVGNPNQTQIAARIATLEHAEACMAFSSGMGAINSMFWTVLQSGDHIVADDTLYGCTYALLSQRLPRLGIKTTFVDFNDLAAIKSAITKNTRFVYCETPANPNMKVVDIEAVASVAHAANKETKVVVDNTFATPYLQRPIDLGADMVIHSGTKYLNGHGDVICGFLCAPKAFAEECTVTGLKYMTGAVMSPFDAFLVDRGIKTLDMRMERHCKNAMEIAEFLSLHKKVKVVYYPGLKSHPQYTIAKKQMRLPGAMIAFELNASREETERFINSLELCYLAVSLGDAETLIEHPASMTHSTHTAEELVQSHISESLLRLSVGLENAADIIADLKKHLD